MKLSRRTTPVSDKAMTWMLRLGTLALATGVLLLAGIYYQDQHVNAGPSLIGRQIEGAEAAVRKTPSDIGIRLQLAAAYQSNKQSDEALKQYDEILRAEGSNKTALLGRGGVLLAKGDLQGATVAYHKITNAARTGEFAGADPQLAEARYYLGSIALKQGKAKEAIVELTAALKVDRTDSDALYLLGVAQLKAGAPNLAVVALKRAVLFVPAGWCEPYSQLALAYGRLGQTPHASYASAMTSFCQKKAADAKRQLKTLTTGPVAVEALLALGLIAQTESSNPEAIAWYQKVLTVDRTNVNAVSALSQLGVGPTKGLGAK